jgi:diguanylate cyclase (GGDEF)-like protein/PAS domain S-box-containing protein
LTHPDDIKTDLNHVDELLEGRSDTYTMDKRYRCKDGEYVWGKLTVALVRNELGDPEYFISVIEDIEQQKVATSLLYQSEKKFRSIVDQLSKEMVVWMSTPGVKEMLYVNDGYENIWGRSSSSLYERPQSFIDLVHPEDKQRVVEHLVSHAEGNWDVNYRIVRDDGEVRYIHDVGFGILDENQTLNFLIGTALDRTNDEKMQLSLKQAHADLMQAHEELKKASIVDPLTKAFNRGELQRIAEEEIRRFVRGEYNSTLVILDLNDFKEINDNFGHNIGDKALQNFAEHLRKHFRELDKLGRFGGDEFVMILPNTNEEQANILINRLSQKLVNVRVNESQNIPVDCSIGFAHLTEKLVDFDSWIAEADQRMYADKRNSKVQK